MNGLLDRQPTTGCGADASSIAFGNADKYLRAGSYDGYVADDWRWKSNLTLNVGLRWEYSSPITERYGRLVNLDVAPGFSAIAPPWPISSRSPASAAN